MTITKNIFQRDIGIQLCIARHRHQADLCRFWNFDFPNLYEQVITSPSPIAHVIPKGKGIGIDKKRAS